MDPTQASELMTSAQELLLELDAEEWCTPYGLGGAEECIRTLQKSIEAITGKPWHKIIQEVRKSARYQALQNRKLQKRNEETRRMEEVRRAGINELRQKRRQLKQFIKNALANGGRSLNELKAAAENAGVPWCPIEQWAAVNKTRIPGEGWVWTLRASHIRQPH
jgi:hypothetical protein